MFDADAAPAQGRLSGLGAWWEQRLLGIRDTLFSNARFQAVAFAFPLTRPIARSRASALFDLCAGFVYSQVLLALVQTEGLEKLRRGPLSIEAWSREVGLPVAAGDRLARAGASLDLLSIRRNGDVGLGRHGAALLGTPHVMAMIRHHQLLYDDLRDPVACLGGGPGQGRLAAFWAYAGQTERPLEPQSTAPYSELMRATQGFIANEVVASFDFSRHRRIMDIGGGTGAFLRAVGAAAPEAELLLFDLPSVAGAAIADPANDGIAGRLEAMGGDFTRDSLPQGADLVTAVRILHDHDDPVVAALLARIRQCLPPGGKLLIAEPMAGTRGARAMGDAYFGMYLWAMGSGRPRTARAYQGFLRAAGFRHSREVRSRNPLLVRMIEAW